MENKDFWQVLKRLGIEYDEKKAQLLKDFFQLLKEENEKFNLTRIIEEEEVYWKHYYDSLTIVEAVNMKDVQKVCDVGSGAGFPGIVLKIFFPHIELYLIEATAKKTKFLQMVIEKLALECVFIVNERAEEVKKREYFDLVVSRATAPLPIIIEISMHLAKKNGKMIYYSTNISREINLLGNKTGLALIDKKRIKLPDNKGERVLICIEKNKETPLAYPRNYAQIKKKPMF